MFLIINVVIVASSTVSILSRNAFISSSFYRADMRKRVKFLYDCTSRSVSKSPYYILLENGRGPSIICTILDPLDPRML